MRITYTLTYRPKAVPIDLTIEEIEAEWHDEASLDEAAQAILDARGGYDILHLEIQMDSGAGAEQPVSAGRLLCQWERVTLRQIQAVEHLAWCRWLSTVARVVH